MRPFTMLLTGGLLMTSLTACKSMKSNFEDVSGTDHPMLPWNTQNLFVMRVSLNENYVVHSYDGTNQSVLSDIPFQEYTILSKNPSEEDHIVEEVYLYLEGWNTSTEKSGEAIYISTFPVSEARCKFYFNDNPFVSTAPLNYVMLGRWTYDGKNNLTVDVSDNKNKLTLRGNNVIHEGAPLGAANDSIEYEAPTGPPQRLYEGDFRSPFIRFTHVSHPKPNEEDRTSEPVAMSHVFDVASSGIRLNMDTTRTWLHPSVSPLSKYADESDRRDHMTCYQNNSEAWRITHYAISHEQNRTLYFQQDPAHCDHACPALIAYRIDD